MIRLGFKPPTSQTRSRCSNHCTNLSGEFVRWLGFLRFWDEGGEAQLLLLQLQHTFCEALIHYLFLLDKFVECSSVVIVQSISLLYPEVFNSIQAWAFQDWCFLSSCFVLSFFFHQLFITGGISRRCFFLFQVLDTFCLLIVLF